MPMAGKSSRFPNMRPKWMLTHPMSNRFMCVESLLGINLNFFDKIYFVCLNEHEHEYGFSKSLIEQLEDLNLEGKSEIIYLNNQTSSQSETVFNAIKHSEINGFIFIKDSDGYYECVIENENNQVVYFDLNDIDDINARTKSYIQFDINGLITNIVEKKVISSTFSVGGYAFSNAEEFCKTYEKFKTFHEECYISHIIFDMLLTGSLFYGLKSYNFKDWGTIEAWSKYKNEYKCLFIDIDGTLVENSSIHFPPYLGNATPLQKNIELIQELHKSGKVKIILTTSRPEKMKELTIQEMNKIGVPYSQLIMNLPHCKRIIINDFANTNQYPSCEAINIPRNNDILHEFLK